MQTLQKKKEMDTFSECRLAIRNAEVKITNYKFKKL